MRLKSAKKLKTKSNAGVVEICGPWSRGASRGLIPARRVSSTRRHPCVNTPKRDRKFNAGFAPLLRGSFRLVGGVFVNSPPAFLSQPAGFHILHQQGSRPVFFAQSSVQVLKNMQTSIEADEVNQLKRAHG